MSDSAILSRAYRLADQVLALSSEPSVRVISPSFIYFNVEWDLLTFFVPRRLEELARAVAAAGGVQQSLQALRHFPNDVDVQKAGCHALANMSLEGEAFVREKETGFHPSFYAECVADDVVANGGLELMLAAIARFPDDAELQDSACRAIGSLAANGEKISAFCPRERNSATLPHASTHKHSHADGLCRQVATAGGMRVVLEAMKKHKESDLVQECGCWAIVSMSENCTRVFGMISL